MNIIHRSNVQTSTKISQNRSMWTRIALNGHNCCNIISQYWDILWYSLYILENQLGKSNGNICFFKNTKTESTPWIMNGWMNEWTYEWMNEWMNEGLDDWNELMNLYLHNANVQHSHLITLYNWLGPNHTLWLIYLQAPNVYPMSKQLTRPTNSSVNFPPEKQHLGVWKQPGTRNRYLLMAMMSCPFPFTQISSRLCCSSITASASGLDAEWNLTSISLCSPILPFRAGNLALIFHL